MIEQQFPLVFIVRIKGAHLGYRQIAAEVSLISKAPIDGSGFTGGTNASLI